MDENHSISPSPLPCPQLDFTKFEIAAVLVLITVVCLKVAYDCYILRRAIINGSAVHAQQRIAAAAMQTEPKTSDRALLLREIPVCVYPHSGLSTGNGCAICLEAFEREEEVRILPRCDHLYHKECIDEWLLERSVFCPVCRAQVLG